MKKFKNLSMLLIAVIMSSTGLVSCIDNDISPVVEDIYRNQALLIASQANLNDAKAAYEQAKAALDNARAAAVTSAASDASQAQDDASAAAAQHLSEHEAALEQTIALYAIALENALLDLEEAKMLWEAKMIELQADIDAAGVALASGYFTNYQAAKAAAIIQEGLAILKQSAIETAQLLVNDMEGVSWEYYLAQQNGILTGLESELAAKQAAAAELAAVIADPSTAASQSSALQAMQDENDAAMDAIDIEIAELEASLLPIFEELGGFGDLDDDYHDTKDQIEDVEGNIEYLTMDIEDNEDDIADLMADIASYDADLAAAEAAVTAAEAAVTAADAAEAAASDAADDAQDVEDDAATALADATADWAAQEGAVNAAAAALVVALNATDGGAQATLDGTLVTQIGTNAEYAIAKSLFDADPTGATHVDGEHNGDDGVLGDHSDIPGDSYRQLSTVDVDNPTDPSEVTWANATIYSDGTVLPVLGFVATAGFINLTSGDDGLYFDVEADDDVPMSNEDRFTAATAAKLTADDAVDAAQLVVDGIDLQGDIDAAQDEYDAQVIIFEAGETLVDAAQVVFDDADAASDAADVVYSDASDASDDADLDLAEANYDLMDLEDYTPADMQEDIEELEHEIVEYNFDLGINEARLVDLEAELAVIEAELEAAGSGEAYEALIAVFNEIEVLENEQYALEMMNYQMMIVIYAIDMDNADLQDILDDCWDAIAGLEDSIEAQEVLIAMGQIDEAAAEAAIMQLESELAAIEASIDGYNDLATKYWDLMQAALAA